MRTKEHLHNILYKAKAEFDTEVVLNPTLSPTQKQLRWRNFVNRPDIRSAAYDLRAIENSERAEEIQREALEYRNIQRGKWGIAS